MGSWCASRHARRAPPPDPDCIAACEPVALSRRQLSALAHATCRELTWTLSAVAHEVGAWRTLAEQIPDDAIRSDALSSLTRKRGHTDGAALFCILARKRNLSLVRLLVAYEITWDLLDSVNEHGAEQGQQNGKQLHRALVDALDLELPLSDYYRYHPWRDDGGYLLALIRVCRATCVQLPSFAAVQPLLLREAWRGQVLAINHDLDPVRRDRGLREWTREEWPDFDEAYWYELTGASSASLTVHALFALAAKPSVTDEEITSVHRAYNPWISTATTMLDSFVDQAEDVLNGDHSYVGHYPSNGFALARVTKLVRRAMREASTLDDGARHNLIVAAMLAMYLAKDSARTTVMRSQSRALIEAGGPLARLLLPILRLWRVAYSQRSN